MERRFADIDDLELELWLRQRDEGLIVWKTKSGETIQLKNMSDNHLKNAINHSRKIEELNEIASEYSAHIDSKHID